MKITGVYTVMYMVDSEYRLGREHLHPTCLRPAIVSAKKLKQILLHKVGFIE